ncbi:hypothetical protein [Tenacibaculum sp. 190524A05c]|uniref:hypothetical protein n=1 Tax=Tenacibaculum platacis TaxID=3137852 RepID=UPI0031FB7BB7
MLNKSISINQFLLGIFFLIWATNAYVLFGSIGKYASLLLGILFLMKSLIKEKLDPSTSFLIIKGVLVYILFIFVGIEMNQKTITSTIVIFGLICMVLFFLGGLLRVNFVEDKENNKRIVVLISTLVLLGSIKLYGLQSLISSNKTRGLGDSTLNAVGVAYIYGQLFILLFWFFVRERRLWLKIFLTLALVSIVGILFITQSRGALLFLVITLLFAYKKHMRFLFSQRNIMMLFLIVLIVFFLFKGNSLIQEKIDLVIQRFDGAINYLSKGKNDGSLEERKGIIRLFINNYDQMFLGQYGYEPYPHNQFLEIFMRWGIFGIPIIIISLISIFKAFKFFKLEHRNYKTINYLIVSIFFFSYLQSMSSLSLEMNRFMWFGFGFLIKDYYLKSKKLTNI